MFTNPSESIPSTFHEFMINLLEENKDKKSHWSTATGLIENNIHADKKGWDASPSWIAQSLLQEPQYILG